MGGRRLVDDDTPLVLGDLVAQERAGQLVGAAVAARGQLVGDERVVPGLQEVVPVTPGPGAAVAGVGLVLAPQRTERSLAQITVAPDTANAEPLADAALEDLRTAIPALRALPLLRKLALGEGGAICLDYLPPMQLVVTIQPC